MGKNRDGMLFRTKMRGYSKKDVNAYISSMNANFASLEETYKSMINHMQADAERSAAEYERAKGEYSAKIEELEAALEQKEILLSEANQKLCETSEKLCEAEKRANEAQSSPTATQKQSFAERVLPKNGGNLAREFNRIASINLSVHEKARLFDRFSLRFREIISDAKVLAERIVREARVRQMNERVDKLCEEFEQRSENDTTDSEWDEFLGVTDENV